MKRYIMILGIYVVLMVALYFTKELFIQTCEVHRTSINIGIFILHMVFIFVTILLTGNEIQNVSVRYIVHSALAVFYLTMLYLFLKFDVYQVLCNI